MFIIISLCIFFLLFNEFIWNKYIVNPTAWDALEEKPGQGGTGWEIDNDNMLAVLYPEEGFHIYLVSKGFWGWTIKDDIAIPNEKNSAPFTAEKQSLKLKGKDEIDVIFIVSHDKEIDYLIAYDENGDEYLFNKTLNKEILIICIIPIVKKKFRENLLMMPIQLMTGCYIQSKWNRLS